MRVLRHNDKPNCQGISAEFVAAHFASYMFVRVSGDKLSYYMLDESLKQYGPPSDFQRAGV